MKAIKRLLGGIGMLLITICFLIMSYNAIGVWVYLLFISLLTCVIGIGLTIAGIFTKVESTDESGQVKEPCDKIARENERYGGV